MSAKQKETARRILEQRDLDALRGWAGEQRRALATLFSLTFEADMLMRWRAVEATGIAAAVKAQQSVEKVRDFLRRLFWLMNDESGGLGWHAPEVIGEVLVNIPALIPESGGLLPHYFNEEPFETGAVAAVARVGRVAPEVVRSHRDAICVLLESPVPERRYYALKALVAAGERLPPERGDRLRTDDTEVTVYDFDNGELVRRRVNAALTAPRTP